jgi:histidine triad (HIT) family protein
MTGGSRGCGFCAILRGETASHVVFEDGVSLAFLDHRPLFPGHCLLIPREHRESLADLPVELLQPFFANAQLLARAVERAFEAEGSFVAINNRVSQSVPHLHVHIVPRRRGDGLRGFFWPRQRYEDAEAALRAQSALREALAALRAAPPE